MQQGAVPGYQDRTPLFPGGTCYPLSGETAVDERLDQLSVIFGVIGTPSPEDISAIGKANEYIKTLGKIQPKKLKDLFPKADPAALDLLKQMLKFNPKRRCTAEEALEHEFLKGVRKEEMERTAEKPLVGPRFLDAVEIDLQTLKRRTYEEVLWYRNQDDHPPKKNQDNHSSENAPTSTKSLESP
jgi:mitogen-activated protein kinase 1/3